MAIIRQPCLFTGVDFVIETLCEIADICYNSLTKKRGKIIG